MNARLPPGTLLLVAFAAGLLAACGNGEEASEAMAPEKGPAAPKQESTQVPEGAIEIGDELYMVPVGPDAGGCEQFTMWSPTKAVAMLIHYRDGKGGFTPDRSQADCPPMGGGSR